MTHGTLRGFDPVRSTSTLLQGRRIFVTGAAGGIGAGICRALKRHGACCFGVDIAPAENTHICDVTDPASIVAAFEAAETETAITDVVHAAGILSIGSVLDTRPEEFRQVIDVNLTGSFLVAQEAARRLPNGGTITFVSSQAGLKGGALWAAYAASKAGVLRLTEGLAQELGPRGVRVNAVCPGNVDTPMANKAFALLSRLRMTDPQQIQARYVSGIPLGRLAHPDEIGDVCVFLVSALSSYISGVALLADGGEVSG